MNLKKILMVDDDPSIRRITEITLTKLKGWQIILAESGAQALELIPKENPDLILMDVMMPGMDGVSTFNRLKEMGCLSVPVIFMTAKVQNQEMEAYEAMGAAGVISKPFSPAELPDQIIDIAAKWIDQERKLCSK